LLSARNVANLVVHFGICIGFQVAVYEVILHESDYRLCACRTRRTGRASSWRPHCIISPTSRSASIARSTHNVAWIVCSVCSVRQLRR
jgi:hypothetical protein